MVEQACVCIPSIFQPPDIVHREVFTLELPVNDSVTLETMLWKITAVGH